ncbi:MAG: ribonuclease H-like domain-containing protein [Pseudomonadota bacterium]
MAIRLHQRDLPAPITGVDSIAIDTEAMGLQNGRDRLCVVQLSTGDGAVDLVQIHPGQTEAPHICALLKDPSITKLFHFGRFDMAILAHAFGPIAEPIYCTKIASRIARTYTDRHGLKELARELLGEEISKQQQSSDWGAPTLTDAQQHYAAHDVLFLHRIRDALNAMLEREGRAELAAATMKCLPTRVALDLAGWGHTDIFAHS